MSKLTIRRATAADIPGICHVNRGEPGPWAEINSCTRHVLNRMQNGFTIQAAELDGRIVGHGEWIVSDSCRGRTFYLGQLQIDPDYQRRGIGQKMIEDGIRRAKSEHCESITLLPEQETGSQFFYEKCGFARGRELWQCPLPAVSGPLKGKTVKTAPHKVVKALPFLFGLTQTAAEHMWQVYNRPAPGDGRLVFTLLDERCCLQLGGYDKSKSALLLAWSDLDTPLVIARAQAFAASCGFPGVDFCFFTEPLLYFPKDRVEPYNFEMFLPL